MWVDSTLQQLSTLQQQITSQLPTKHWGYRGTSKLGTQKSWTPKLLTPNLWTLKLGTSEIGNTEINWGLAYIWRAFFRHDSFIL
jgi:hypothetical protein